MAILDQVMALVAKQQADKNAADSQSDQVKASVQQPRTSAINAAASISPSSSTDNSYLNKIGLRGNNFSRGLGLSRVSNLIGKKYAEEDAAYQSKLAETESMRAYDKVFGTHTPEAYPIDPSIERAAKAQAYLSSRINSGKELEIAPLKSTLRGLKIPSMGNLTQEQGE